MFLIVFMVKSFQFSVNSVVLFVLRPATRPVLQKTTIFPISLVSALEIIFNDSRWIIRYNSVPWAWQPVINLKLRT